MERLSVDPSFAGRSVNEEVLRWEKPPDHCTGSLLRSDRDLDETDSGLDIDALKVVSVSAGCAPEAFPGLLP